MRGYEEGRKALSVHSIFAKAALGGAVPHSASWKDWQGCTAMLSGCLRYVIQLGSNPKGGLRSRVGVMGQLEDRFQHDRHFLQGKTEVRGKFHFKAANIGIGKENKSFHYLVNT